MEINSITTFPNRVLATSCDFQIIDEKANLSGAIHPSIIHPCTYHVPGSVVGSGKWQSWDGKGLLPEPTGLAVLSAAPPPQVRPAPHLVKLTLAPTGHGQVQSPNPQMLSFPFLLKQIGIKLKALF